MQLRRGAGPSRRRSHQELIVSARQAIRSFGVDGVIELPSPHVATFYRVSGDATTGPREGSSVSFAGVPTLEEARRQLTELRALPENAHLDDWYVVEHATVIRSRVVPESE